MEYVFVLTETDVIDGACPVKESDSGAETAIESAPPFDAVTVHVTYIVDVLEGTM